MSFEIIKRHLINNKVIIWNFIKFNKNYSICTIDKKALFRGCLVNNRGSNNKIIIEEGAKVNFCTFNFDGDNNTVLIKKNSVINGCVFFGDQDNNRIEIGEYSTFTGKSEFIATEGTSIEIGKDCMFAYGIVLRTGDHHSILNHQGDRFNLAKSIKLAEHVWVGQNAYLLKGVEIKSGCVIGACSVVTKGTSVENSILAGNPAQVIKSEISWDRKKI